MKWKGYRKRGDVKFDENNSSAVKVYGALKRNSHEMMQMKENKRKESQK